MLYRRFWSWPSVSLHLEAGENLWGLVGPRDSLFPSDFLCPRIHPHLPLWFHIFLEIVPHVVCSGMCTSCFERFVIIRGQGVVVFPMSVFRRRTCFSLTCSMKCLMLSLLGNREAYVMGQFCSHCHAVFSVWYLPFLWASAVGAILKPFDTYSTRGTMNTKGESVGKTLHFLFYTN